MKILTHIDVQAQIYLKLSKDESHLSELLGREVDQMEPAFCEVLSH